MSRVKKLPDGWKRTALDSICDLQAGKFVPASEILETCNGSSYPCYGGNGLRGFVKDYSHSGTFPLIGRQGALCGNINKASGKFYATEHAVVATPNTNIEVEWLYYQLIYANLNKYATGAAQPGLSVKNIKEIPFIVPPLPEQKAIADLLSIWDEAIEKTERLIQAKKKRFRWLLQELISEPQNTQKNTEWKWVKLGEVCKIVSKEKLRSVNGHFLLTVKLHCLGIERNNRIAPKLTERGRPYFQHKSGDFLIGRQNFHNGGFGIIPPELDGGITSNAISCLIVNESKLSKDFLWFQFANPNYYKKIGHVMDGTGQKELSDKQILKLKIRLPGIETQNHIAETLSSVQREVGLLKQLADKYKTQKRSLMQKMLTGEWRMRGFASNDEG